MSNFTGQVQVDFVHDPTSASFTWVDITNRARTASYRRGRNYERAQVEAGTGTLTLRNDDGALDPTNGASTFAPNVLPFKRIQHNVTVTGPGTVPIFTGLVERWPQEWDNGYGSAPVQVVDIFAWLALAELRSAMQQEILADAPFLYMPLTDDSNTTTPSMVVAPAGAFTALQESKYGGGTFSFAGGNGPAAENTQALTITNPVGSFTNGGVVRALNFTPLVVSSAGVVTTTVIRLNYTGTTAAVAVLAGLQPAGALTGFYFGLQLDASGHVSASFNVSPGGTIATSPQVITDGQPHDLMAVLTSTGGTNYQVAIWVDGTQRATAALSSPADFTAAEFQVGGEFFSQLGTVQVPSSGTFSHAAVFRALPNFLNHYNAGANGFAGETADTRIARILRYIGWTPTTALDACPTTMLAADLAGKSALAAIQEVQASEGGVFFASKAGVLTYKSRRTRMQTTASAATFGENTAGGEVPYLNAAFDFDPTYVYNDVQITRTGSGHAVAAADSTSQGHYGKRTYPATFGTQSDAEAQDAANWTLYTSLAPHARVRSITVDALATPGAWAALLPLEVGSRVTIKRRPNNAAPAITVNSFVESIAWDIVDSKRAMCTLELSPIPVQALIADDATYGLCDSTFVAAW